MSRTRSAIFCTRSAALAARPSPGRPNEGRYRLRGLQFLRPLPRGLPGIGDPPETAGTAPPLRGHAREMHRLRRVPRLLSGPRRPRAARGLNLLLFVVPGLVPAIHENKGVDARDKAGHDGLAVRAIEITSALE